MRRAAAILTAFAALAGCAGPGPDAGAKPARIVLRPTEDSYRSAVEELSPAERAVVKKGFGFTVDTLLNAPTPVETMTWSHVRADTPASVDISAFVRFLDAQSALSGAVRVNLATARVLAGITHESDTFTPVFKIQAEVVPSNTGTVSITAVGGGPVCKRSRESMLDSTEITQSEQVAFMKALLKTLLRVNTQLRQVQG
ncbi:MAG TPA: hypothetical protein VGG37_00265 [Opitutaceae bacterium]|jgi:hypothetical protein